MCMDDVGRALAGLRADRVAVLCIGNAQRGDDGFGPAVAERIRNRTAPAVFDGRDTPENELPRIARLEPETVLLVDAVEFGGAPGEVRVLSAEAMREDDVGTHAASLGVLATFLRDACGASCLVLAAQPGGDDVGLAPEPGAGRRRGPRGRCPRLAVPSPVAAGRGRIPAVAGPRARLMVRQGGIHVGEGRKR